MLKVPKWVALISVRSGGCYLVFTYLFINLSFALGFSVLEHFETVATNWTVCVF